MLESRKKAKLPIFSSSLFSRADFSLVVMMWTSASASTSDLVLAGVHVKRRKSQGIHSFIPSRTTRLTKYLLVPNMVAGVQDCQRKHIIAASEHLPTRQWLANHPNQ